MTDPKAVSKFANDIAAFVNKYHLDGVSIDDEYSNCVSNNTSMIMISQTLKQNPNFSGKILTKALWSDSDVFSSTYGKYKVKLVDFLNSGSEMTYSGTPDGNLTPYVGYGMSPNDLTMGVSTNSPSDAASDATNAMNKGWGGIMVYNVTSDSTAFVKTLEKAEYGKQNISVLPNCLEKSYKTQAK